MTSALSIATLRLHAWDVDAYATDIVAQFNDVNTTSPTTKPRQAKVDLVYCKARHGDVDVQFVILRRCTNTRG